MSWHPEIYLVTLKRPTGCNRTFTLTGALTEEKALTNSSIAVCVKKKTKKKLMGHPSCFIKYVWGLKHVYAVGRIWWMGTVDIHRHLRMPQNKKQQIESTIGNKWQLYLKIYHFTMQAVKWKQLLKRSCNIWGVALMKSRNCLTQS